MRSDGAKVFPVLSWSLYDLANQFFALNVVSLYFPRWLTLEKNTPEIFYSLTFGLSMLFVAICAPFLGTMSDRKGKHKIFLIILTVISVIFTAALGISNNVFIALVFFAIANFGCQEAIIFYNALMVDIAPRGKIGLVSGLGRMFGYTGAIVALMVTKPVVMKAGYQPAFLVTAALFLVFALPCMIFVKEKRREERPSAGIFSGENFSSVLEDMKKICRVKGFKYFLLASFSVICAVSATMLFMGVYASKVFALAENKIIDLIAFSTVFAIIGSIVSGYISDIVGHRKSLMGVFLLWGVCLIGAGVLKAPFHWAIGALIGLCLGATWVILRAVVVRLIPPENIGKAFALFNLVGYSAGIVGPMFWGLNILYLSRLGATGYRLGLLSLIIFIVMGIIFLQRMRTEDQK
ncbi:MAG: MFS transporter [Candidatus Omnitrophota bacterium]